MSQTTERKRLSRLLIVEDDEAQLLTLTDLLKDEGFTVIGCTTATEALEHVDREDFGVAVVDLRLPDLTGTQLLKKITALNDKVRVIINTGYASFDSAKEALNLGAFAYVEKAGDPDELIRHVHAAARWHFDRYAKDLEDAIAASTRDLRKTNEELKMQVVQRARAEKERERLTEQLRQAQKMEALGQLAGGVAHDFNNLLTAILGNTEMLLTPVDDSALERCPETLKYGLEQIRSAGERAALLTKQLLAFSRKEVTKPEVLDPKRAVAEMEEVLRQLVNKNVTLDFLLEPVTHSVCVDPGQIERLVMNLAVNGADAMPNGGRLQITLRDTDLDANYLTIQPDAKLGPHVLLSVADSGIGMTPDLLSRIYEPFFTTKPPGKGTGLGLATVYGIVKQLGGHITVDSTPDEGSTFNVYLPATEEAVETKKIDDTPARAGSGETILVCEDQAMVRNVICQTLQTAGYTVIEAENGEQAIQAIAAHDGPVDLLISDVVMPGTNGQDLANGLSPAHPEMRVLLISGYTADLIDNLGITGGGIEFLQKPFGPATLLNHVRKILDAQRVT